MTTATAAAASYGGDGVMQDVDRPESDASAACDERPPQAAKTGALDRG